MVDAITEQQAVVGPVKKDQCKCKGDVPKDIEYRRFDLCVIIGNLLDNAMEACLKQPEDDKRFIRVYIGLLRQQLYIYVSNSVGGKVIKNGGSYISTKNFSTHGFGLMRVDKIAGKYGGYINRQDEEGVFATEVMLPL
jgi:sensor histidine kinase regulating citrate/malate metabolism